MPGQSELPKAENLANGENDESQNSDVNTEENENVESESIDELKARIAALEASKSRVEDESKKNKAQKQKLQEQLLIEQGKKDELIASLKEQVEAQRERNKQRAILEAIALEAPNHNCEDWDFLYSLSDDSCIQYDEETERVSGVKDMFLKARENKRFSKFFSDSKQIETDNLPPGIPPKNSLETIDFKANPLHYLREATKISPEQRALAIKKLQREGLLK
jgi:uncharacterized small protein (DUF1192 family)